MQAIRDAGGEVYGVTSEPHSLASEAERAWDMSIPVIGDPHHDIRQDLKRRGVIDIFYNTDYGHLRERGWASHPNGYYQPAVVALHRSERILYRWRCVPKYSNMSGAGGRPEAQYTWDKIQTRLQDMPQTDGPPAEPASDDPALDQKPILGSPDLSWFKFLVILTAHGWFLRPRAFPLLRDGDKAAVTPGMAMKRAYWFLGAWVIALLLLPVTWVLTAAVLYIVLLTPGLIEIHKQFQNEPDPF